MKPIYKRTALIIGIFLALEAVSVSAFTQDVEFYKNKAREDAALLLQDKHILHALKKHNERNKSLTADEISELDRKWHAEVKSGELDMIDKMLHSNASKVLDAMREASGTVYGEIIIMDRRGLNVAISDATSDYFQGDENKWSRPFLMGKNGIFVDTVEFDESVQAFTSQISLTLEDPETEELLGVVTFSVLME